MNEKIKELAEQATTIVGVEHCRAFDREVIDQEKFAELIIHSCIDAVISVPLPNEYEQRCAESVREYFGIKV